MAQLFRRTSIAASFICGLVLLSSAREAARLSAVPVQLGHDPLRPVPLLAVGRHAHHLLGPRRERRHHQPGRRRLVPARAVGAAVVAGAGRRPALRRPAQRRRRRRIARGRVLPDAGRSLHPPRLRFVLAERHGGRARRRAPGRSQHRRTQLRRAPADDVARALPHVAAERDRPLRARRPLSGALRAALRRAHLLRAALHRLQPLRGDLQPLGRLRHRRLGGARDGVHEHPEHAARLPGRLRRGREGRRRLRRAPLQQDGGRRPADARRHRQRGGALSGRRRRQALGREGAPAVPGRGRLHPAAADQGVGGPEPVRLLSGRHLRHSRIHGRRRLRALPGRPRGQARPGATPTTSRSTSSPRRTSRSGSSDATSG